MVIESRFLAFALALAFCICGSALGQAVDAGPKAVYSESISYEPLGDKAPEGKGKKKKNEKSEKRAEANAAPTPSPTTVCLPLSVYNAAGQFVPDISAGELEVFFDDVRVEIKKLKGPESPSEIVLLVDTSPSLLYSLENVQKFLNLIVSQFRADDRVTVAGFDGRFIVILDSSTDRNAIGKAFKKLKFDSGTALYEAIDQVTSGLGAPIDLEGKRVFLITDGVDTTSRKSSLGRSLANTLKSNAVYFPIYLDSFAENEKAQKKTARVIANIPGLGPVFNSQPIFAEDYALGREYLTNLLRITGGLAFMFPANDAEASDVAKKAALAARSRYSIIIDRGKLPDSIEPKRLRVRINRPGLSVLTKSSIALD